MYEMLWRHRVWLLHFYVLHPKYSQDFGSSERNQRPNHELILKYQVQIFGDAGMSLICSLHHFSMTLCWINSMMNNFDLKSIQWSILCLALISWLNTTQVIGCKPRYSSILFTRSRMSGRKGIDIGLLLCWIRNRRFLESSFMGDRWNVLKKGISLLGSMKFQWEENIYGSNSQGFAIFCWLCYHRVLWKLSYSSRYRC